MKRKRDVSKIKKENKRIEKWLKILPKYHATITNNPDKSNSFVRRSVFL